MSKKTTEKQRFVAYYRVSTKKQSREMPAQKTAVKNYLKNRWPPEKYFIEQESGKADHNRPELQKALAFCYENNATLIVAKLDRLSRDLKFIAWLQDTDIDFVCCDMPQATRETIGIFGVMARWEREQIARRTKEALAEKKKQGVKLGCHNPKIKKALDKYWKAHKKENPPVEKKKPRIKKKKIKKISKVKQADSHIVSTIKLLRAQHHTFADIAEVLNNIKIKSRFGARWHKTSVLRVADRNDIL